MKVNMKLSHIFEDEDESIDYQIGKGFDEKLKNFLAGQTYLDLLNYYITDVEVKTPLGSSILHFDIEPLLKITDMSDDDIRLLRLLFDYYSDYELVDSYTTYSDFEEGYGIWAYMNNENINLLKIIKDRISPDEEIDFLDNDVRKFNLKMIELFPTEMDYIINDYSHNMNVAHIKSLREKANEILNDVLDESKIKFKNPFEEMTTTAAELYMNILVNQFDGSLEDLLFILLGNRFNDLIDLEQDIYLYYDENNFDKISFNRFSNLQLKKIVDQLNKIEL